MRIGGLIKFSLIDYPSKLAAVIFTQGCNFRCPFCHNPELVMPHLFNKTIPTSEIFNFLKKRKKQLEGVVVTGGEPTLQKNLTGFIKKIRDMDYSVKLDTNGSYPEIIEKLLKQKYLDYIAMDIKAPFKKYAVLSGVNVNIKMIKKSIDLIKSSGIPHEFRTTFAKPLNQNDLQKIKKELTGNSKHTIQECKEY